MPERAFVFVDGNNWYWYHGLRDLGFTNLGWLNYAKVSEKLIRSPREWKATRYYVGQVQQRGDLTLYAEQRRYMAWLTSLDPRISIHYGRLEQRPAKDRAALVLRRYLANLPTRLSPKLYKDLSAIADLSRVMVTVEKAVDVMLAVDMVSMAIRDEYDVAYLLAADGDYTPAAEVVRGLKRLVIAAAPRAGAQLAAKVDT